MSKIVNLTPHTINEATTGKAFPPSGFVLRTETKRTELERLDGIPVYSTLYGKLTGWPDKIESDTVFIVSTMIARQAKLEYEERIDRQDSVRFCSPGELVRDDEGNPIGCRGFNLA